MLRMRVIGSSERYGTKEMRNKGKKIYVLYSIEFLIIAAGLLICLGNFSLITTGDGYNQFYPVIVYCGKYIRSLLTNIMQGNFLFPQFDFSIGLGEGVIPALNCYGFGDPFMLISACFPAAYSAYAYTAIVMAKVYVSGLSFIFYCRKRNCETKNILMGISVYIGSQYVLCNSLKYPTTFLNVMISLPFLCAGIDEIIERRKDSVRGISLTLVLAVAFQSISGFYPLYMELLFAAVYALVGLLCKTKEISAIIKKALSLFTQIVLGIGMGAVLFIPSLVGFFTSGRSGDADWIGWKELFKFDRYLGWKLFSSIIIPQEFQEVGLILPFASILLVYIAMKKGEKIVEIKWCLALFLLAYVNMRITSWIAGGFTASIYYGRWIFCLIFLIAYMTVEGGSYIEIVSAKQWMKFSGVILGYILLVAVVERLYFKGSVSEERYITYLLYMVWVIVVSITFYFVDKYNKRNMKQVLIVGSILIATVLNVYTLFYLKEYRCAFKLYDSVRSEIIASDAKSYSVQEGFGRIDIQGAIRNESLYRGNNSANEYLSMINGNIVEFYKQYAMVAEMWGSVHHLIGLGGRSGIMDLLSVAYYNDAKKEKIVNNQDYLPLGVIFDDYILEKDAESMNAIEKTASVLEKVIVNKELAGEGINQKSTTYDGKQFLTEESFSVQYVNVKIEDSGFSVTPESKIIISFNNESPGECYFYADKFKLIESSNSLGVGHVYFDGIYCEFKSEEAFYTHGVEETSICMGDIEAGKMTFEITFQENGRYELGNIHIYTLDSEELKKLNAERHKKIMQDVEVGANYVKGSITTG